MRCHGKLALTALACCLPAVLAACGEPECTVVEAYQFDFEEMCLLSRERVEVGCYKEADRTGLGAFQCIYNPERNLLVWEPHMTSLNSRVASEPGFSDCPGKLETKIIELESYPNDWPLCRDSETSASDSD